MGLPYGWTVTISSKRCQVSMSSLWYIGPDSKVHGANMGPTWVLLAPDGPHVGPRNLAIRGYINLKYAVPNVTTRVYVYVYIYVYIYTELIYGTKTSMFSILWQHAMHYIVEITQKLSMTGPLWGESTVKFIVIGFPTTEPHWWVVPVLYKGKYQLS